LKDSRSTSNDFAKKVRALRARVKRLESEVVEGMRTEKALRQREALWRTLIDANPESALLINRQGTIVAANRATAERLNASIDRLVGSCVDDFISSNLAEDRKRSFEQVTRTRKPTHFRDVRSSKVKQHDVIPLVNKNGEVAQLAVWAKDITEQDRLEQRVQKQAAQLAHASRLMMLGEMAAGLAHELNQPLGAICAYGDACKHLLKPAKLPKLVGLIGKIVDQAMRATRIVQRIRNFTRQQSPQHELLDLNEIIRGTIDLAETQVKRYGAMLSLELCEQRLPVQADEIQIQQVLLNLILNSLQAMADMPAAKRQLVIRSTWGSEGVAEVAVCDYGMGLEASDVERIFEPFVTTKREGLGLGLSISRSILQAHGGRLWATVNPEGGTTFFLTLPQQRGPHDVEC